jgi:hypothetical protein
MEAMSCPALGS